MCFWAHPVPPDLVGLPSIFEFPLHSAALFNHESPLARIAIQCAVLRKIKPLDVIGRVDQDLTLRISIALKASVARLGEKSQVH